MKADREGFVHLHLHSEYSLLDGACRIGDIVARAKEMGQTAAALTDHGVMYGAIDFYKAAKKAGIKPIIGCEVYVAPNTRHDKLHKIDTSPYHLVLLCKNITGYQNLIKIVSVAYTEGFYFKPRVDRELLSQHTEGLICLSACLAGEVPRKLNRESYSAALEAATFYRDLFGKENYYIELQDHGIPEQQQILPDLIKIAKELDVGVVATNDVHYIKKSDHKLQHLLMCIQTNHTVDEELELEFPTQEFYMKSETEMAELFGKVEGALSNTVKIAEQCNIEFEFGKIVLPHYVAPDGSDNNEFFKKLCYDGLRRRYGENYDKKLEDRLNYEIDTITQMGYVDYYLIVYDFIDHAKSVGIPVGPGRGSGAGSLCAYCCGITGVDPIKYGLIFERFLNPERISMPDFDIDFCYERRQEVIDYVVEKYGEDRVAQIITFGTMAARGAVRDVGRALGRSYQEVDLIAKMIPWELGITIDKALEYSRDLKALYDSDEKVKELLDAARGLEGMPRHASTHAAGVVITREPVDCYVPVQKNDAFIVTQFPMTTLEELGLLKMDFLGLRNLTVIKQTEDMIRATGEEFDITQIDYADMPTYEMLAKGNTSGVFQFESTGMKQVIMQLNPESIEDLTAVISLYRPGPMDSIPAYIRNRHDPTQIKYGTPLLKPILDVTNGCIVYQEQVMQIFREIAGYSYGSADVVRRAMSKKKHDVMEKERERFIEGASKNNVSRVAANRIFEDMSSFASYAFNKSHAACYAIVAYQTAYLKCHYPHAYLAALLTSVIDSTDRVTEYIAECKKLGISIFPPDVNISHEKFFVVNNDICYGLMAVKNIGRGFLNNLINERKKGGVFTSFGEFCERMFGQDMNKRTVEALIKCGAFDSLHKNRKELLVSYEMILDNIESVRRSNLEGQLNLFETPDNAGKNEHVLKKIEDFSQQEYLAMEKETMGIYISGHPLDQYAEIIESKKAGPIGEILSAAREDYKSVDRKSVRVAAIVTHTKMKSTKAGEVMAFIQLEDRSGEIEMLVFPKTFEKSRSFFSPGRALIVDARVSIKEDEPASLVCMEVYDILSAPDIKAPWQGGDRGYSRQGQYQAAKPAPPTVAPKPPQSAGKAHSDAADTSNAAAAKGPKPGLYLKTDSLDSSAFMYAKKVIEAFEGNTPIFIKTQKELVLAPQSLWTETNEVMLKELARILGKDNVKLVE